MPAARQKMAIGKLRGALGKQTARVPRHGGAHRKFLLPGSARASIKLAIFPQAISNTKRNRAKQDVAARGVRRRRVFTNVTTSC